MLIIKLFADGEEKRDEVVHIGNDDGVSLCKTVKSSDKRRLGIPDTLENRQERNFRFCTNCLRKESEATAEKKTANPPEKQAHQSQHERELEMLARWNEAAKTK